MKPLITPVQLTKKNIHQSTQSRVATAFFVIGLFLVAINTYAAPSVPMTEPITNAQANISTSIAPEGQTIAETETVDSSQSNNETVLSEETIDNYRYTFAAQLPPSNKALLSTNQKLSTHNTALQRQVNNLQNQVNVLIYESRNQLFMYGAFTVLISLLVGMLISWLLLRRRERW